MYLPAFRFCLPSLIVALFLSAPAFGFQDTAAPPASKSTQAIQQQLDAVTKEIQDTNKQLSLKQGALEVAQKRAAELEAQLKQIQARIAADKQSVQQLTAKEAAASEQQTQLAANLDKHRHADQLLQVAAIASQQLEAARQQQASLETQLSELQKQQFEQQQAENKAAEELKAAQEALPKANEELTAARGVLDAATKEVEIARSATEQSRGQLATATKAIQPELLRQRQAQQTVNQLDATVKSLQQSLAIMQEAAALTGGDPAAMTAELTATIEGLKPLQQQTTAVLNQAQARVAAAQQQAAQAQQAHDTQSAQLRELQNKYADASRSHFASQLKVADLQGLETALPKRIEEAKAQQTALAAKQTELKTQIAQVQTQIADLNADYVTKQQLAEAAMEPLGRFISFSRHIAPIFAKRCVACHNTRSAGGRLNMDSFAALVKGGESGDAVVSHDAESSLVWIMVDDGSMPKDADPLSKDQIDLIRRWIELGTPVDAGISTSDELFQVMPEVAQPLPPKSYRVPIPITATAFNADGSVLASSGYHEILLWKTDDGSLIRRITNVAERVYDLEFSQDGSQLAVAAGTPGQLGEVKLFSAADGSHLKTLVRTKDAVFAVSYSPDGSQLAAAGADRVVSVVDVASGRTTLQIEDHADWVMDVNWSPDSRQLVTASRDKTSKVFDVASGQSKITFNGHAEAVYSAAFLSDGKSIVSAGSDRQARVWNPEDAKEIRKIGGFGSDIFRVTVTPDNHLLTASADKNAREHNLADGKAIRTFSGHKDWVYTLCYNPQRKLIATGSYDGEIRVWNSEDGSVTTSFIAVPKASDQATVAAFNR
jgi:WD40 repeat protein